MALPIDSVLRLGQHITAIPSIHGRSIFAQEVRRFFLERRYTCIAVELPPGLGSTVLEGVRRLPVISAVVYADINGQHWYVPCEPGDSIIEALRLGLQERAQLYFIDMPVDAYPRQTPPLPDEYAVRQLGLAAYYRAVRSALPATPPGSMQDQRERWMAAQLRRLDAEFDNVLFVCGLAHWEGIRRHFQHNARLWPVEPPCWEPRLYNVHPDEIYFLVGEIPYLTFLFERSRASWDLDEFDKTDGLKELLLESRKEFCRDFPDERERLTPGALQLMLTYMRNLCLIQGRLTPALYEVVLAGQGVGGGAYAARLVEVAKFYPYLDPLSSLPVMHMGLEQAHLPDKGTVPIHNLLPTPPVVWRNIRLERRPKPRQKRRWRYQWNPYGQCSWPPEDELIENFVRHVRHKSRGLLGEDQARVEKFTVSIKDGIDMRETMRQWHRDEIYVKEIPPVRGDVGAVIFIFKPDSPDEFPWRSTWHAEHANESTLCFYATDFRQDLIGPGIARAFYGGALFIFPPQPIPDIWTDPRFAHANSGEEYLTLAGLYYSRQRYVAYVSAQRPPVDMRRVARQWRKHLIYLPLSSFSASTIRKMRKFHVLNGQHVRSYARDFIR